jgi:hypothetical protein
MISRKTRFSSFIALASTIISSNELVVTMPVNPKVGECREFNSSNKTLHIDVYPKSNYKHWVTSYPGSPGFSLTWDGMEWKIGSQQHCEAPTS